MQSECIICGAAFPPRSRKLTCSPECARIRQRRLRGTHAGGQRDAEGYLVIPCAECGTLFRPESGRLRCSVECDTAGRKRLDAERWQRIDKARINALARERRRRKPEVYRAQDRRRADKRRPPAVTRICQRCGVEFAGPRKDARFCGRAECVVPPRRCAECGVEFVGTTRAQIYCGLPCSQLAQRARARARARRLRGSRTSDALTGLALANLQQRAGKYQHRCAECGGGFWSASADARFCRRRCRLDSLAARKRTTAERLQIPPRPCAICGEEFRPRRRVQTICVSAECRAEAKRRLSRAWSRAPEVRERQKHLARVRKNVRAVCRVCGKDMSDLDDLRTNRYTCSDACRAEALRAKNRRSHERRKQRGTDHDSGAAGSGGQQ